MTSDSRSRVIPGRSCVSARRLPARRLKRVDLPTFGRPTMTTFLRLLAIDFSCGATRGREGGGTADATMPHMSSNADSTCRLCGSRVPDADLKRQLCPVCDEYAQHVHFQGNRGIDRVVGEVQNGPAFF